MQHYSNAEHEQKKKGRAPPHLTYHFSSTAEFLSIVNLQPKLSPFAMHFQTELFQQAEDFTTQGSTDCWDNISWLRIACEMRGGCFPFLHFHKN